MPRVADLVQLGFSPNQAKHIGDGLFDGGVTLGTDDAYGAGWNGSLEVPTKNAVYDKIQTIIGLSDGDKGDITVSASGATWTVDADAITGAKIRLANSTFLRWRNAANSADLNVMAVDASNNTIIDAHGTALALRVNGSDRVTINSDNYIDFLSQNFNGASGAFTTFWIVEFGGVKRKIPLYLP